MARFLYPFLVLLSIFSHSASAYFCLQCGNCPDDDNTFCDIGSDTPVCLPGSANVGKCMAQVTITETWTSVFETTTSTRYTSSVDSYDTVSSLVSVTADDQETETEAETSTVIVTETSTTPGSTTAASLKRRDPAGHMRLARDDAINSVPSTTISTTTITDSFYCINTPSDTHCTSTVEGVLTNSLITTVLATTTLPNVAIVTDTTIVTSTTIAMVTAAQGTQSPSPTQPGASTKNTAPTNTQSNGPVPSSTAKPSSSTRIEIGSVCALFIVAGIFVFGLMVQL